MKIHLKILFAKWHPFCSDLSVSIFQFTCTQHSPKTQQQPWMSSSRSRDHGMRGGWCRSEVHYADGSRAPDNQTSQYHSQNLVRPADEIDTLIDWLIVLSWLCLTLFLTQKLKSHETLFIHNFHFWCLIILKVCTDHDGIIAMLCIKPQNNWV